MPFRRHIPKENHVRDEAQRGRISADPGCGQTPTRAHQRTHGLESHWWTDTWVDSLMSPVQTVVVKPLNIVSAGGKRNGFNAFLHFWHQWRI